MGRQIDVIATTISGSIKDWGKVKRIVPLFQQHGETEVNLVTTESHAEARRRTCELVQAGSRIVISAGGSGTFNAVLEGCLDAGEETCDLRLGFLRKGSADLIGKVLGMPDEIEEAIRVFVKAIRQDCVVPCDVLRAKDAAGHSPVRRFVGYGGAELFGRIPHYTENRFIKYYKGVLSQLFGDLGPFFVGTSLAIGEKLVKTPFGKRRGWNLEIDGQAAARDSYQALIIVNGDLGPNLPFARSEPLGGGRFFLFGLRDMGALRLFGQLKHAWDASVLTNPEKWGFESYKVTEKLTLTPGDGGLFPLNTDGSTMICQGSVTVEVCDQVSLLAAPPTQPGGGQPTMNRA